MKGKILLVVGVGVGYVLGARAGRERYEQIKRLSDKFWSSAPVQKQVHNAEDYVKDKAPEVVEFLADGAKKVVSQVAGSKKSTPARSVTSKAAPAKPAARKTPTPRTSTTAKK
ncbi:YtxH domain-containing protein [Glaciihabitans sp. dw_435]|uniref:YtxH domain-containing protein n=1 Tax=Glaciihabitans sp. dw_435 TaxID=2720081 RepID=UPI001BD22799|nr:YtxH domain-containing protein [Glaciihabitans sp. dw_435]